MFFVFGPSGQMYRGGSQLLSQVTPVRGVQRPQALRTGAADIEADRPAPEFKAQPQPQTPAHADAAQSAPMPLRVLEAVSAYVQTELGPAQPRQPLSHVRDVMTRGAISVTPGMHIDEAWRTLAQHQVGQAPVVNEHGLVIGLLLRADIAPPELLPQAEAARDAAALAQRQVAQAMISPVPAVTEEAELRRVAEALIATGLPGLPVTDEAGRLQGFISRTDILRAVAGEPPLDLWS